MNRRLLLWGVPVALWFIFAGWYTDFGGPLSEDEVAEAMTYFDDRGIAADARVRIHQFLANDSGRQFLIVNNIDMSETPPRMEGFGPDATSADYMNHYMEHIVRSCSLEPATRYFWGRGWGLPLTLLV